MFPNSDRFWNPLLETLPRERLRELQVKKFRRIMKWAFDHSKFHRRLYEDAGIEPGDIKTMKDISMVPKVEKSMMRGIQKKDP
ncbi:MAG: phenylacetate--CoA ligase family protein, partial [Deltaproteobacteria bacterium]|nr:phenylacetate--CoA ligase family protein [Deltaproteobacteria bacterium]